MFIFFKLGFWMMYLKMKNKRDEEKESYVQFRREKVRNLNEKELERSGDNGRQVRINVEGYVEKLD